MPAPTGDHPPLPADTLQDAAAIFGMLAATARTHIIWLLADGEKDVGTLAAEIGQTVATTSQHLAKLKLAGLVGARRNGRHQHYFVDNPHLVDIVERAVASQSATPVKRRRSAV
ncbi:ArsR/SmtB family transcription factor [Fodinicola feengrottensis]|uniref:Metalloregulator ArsR/SmtB family transcription factor n=1 Tax=Fodinicola feengrottensis TaxID=435914 RepID=A0ABN2GHS6_9ACTN|nr:metalloregulator ArsR/SmtB family transcription factor [Fodinicola feengrottensis]